MIPALSTTAQVLALLLISLVVGSMFGIWRGYDPAGWSAASFVEVHQGAVRGLNTLLPALGASTIVLVVFLAVISRDRPSLLALYIAAALLMIGAGLVTRFANQPINEIVMGWSSASIPENWMQHRDTWWSWHLTRLAMAFAGEAALVAAIFIDRSA